MGLGVREKAGRAWYGSGEQVMTVPQPGRERAIANRRGTPPEGDARGLRSVPRHRSGILRTGRSTRTRRLIGARPCTLSRSSCAATHAARSMTSSRGSTGRWARGPATANPVTAAELRATQLSAAMRGYAPREVDQALNAALQELEQRGT
jgi:DivIVA domain-containing protein